MSYQVFFLKKNTLTSTVHSTENSPLDLVPCVEVLVNIFNNQIFLKQANTLLYQFNIIFPTFHKHIITEPTYNEQTPISLLKRYLNPSVINGMHTEKNNGYYSKYLSTKL